MNIKVTGFKSLEIQEILDVSYAEIIDAAALTQHPLKYCNGYLLAISGFDPSEDMKNDESNGIYKFQTVGFTSVEPPIYKPVMSRKGSNAEVSVMDFSQSEFYVEITEYIKKYLDEKNSWDKKK